MLFAAACSSLTFAQSIGPSVDPDREVIAMLRVGVLTPPPGRSHGLLSEFQIPSQELRQVLQGAGVEAIGRVIPDFRPEDRFAISRTGEKVELTDWTNVYIVRLASSETRSAILKALKDRPEVVYAEFNGKAEPTLFPNDQFFDRQWALRNNATSQQGNGTPGADIKATQAWDITTGSGNIKIGIVDNGMQTDHPDFTGRVTGDGGDNSGHGTAVAGIAAAQGNNGIGVAGVAWNVGIINEDYGAASHADVAAAVRSAGNQGADVINNSYRLSEYSLTVHLAFIDVYRLNRVAVAGMGNDFGEVRRYPAAFGQGIIAVGATTNTDVRAAYSNTGSWIDIAAPGGSHPSEAQENEDYIYSTIPGGNYGYFYKPGVPNWGTSFAAPHVTGIAALLFSYNSNLYNDDVEKLIQLSADKVPGMQGQNFTYEYGYGRVNARKALDYLRAPYVLTQATATGGTSQGASSAYQMVIYGAQAWGLSDGTYIVKRHEVRRNVTFSSLNSPALWGRGAATNGWADEGSVNFALGWCDVVPGTVTATGATLRTYVYEVWTILGQSLGYKPTTPSNVVYAYTTHGIPQPLAVTITGPSELQWKQQGTWMANAIGGTGTYLYEWRWRDYPGGHWSTVVSTTSQYSRQMRNNDIELQVKVTSGAVDVYDTHIVWLSGGEELSGSLSAQFSLIPETFDLFQNYPNPFNPETAIGFALPEQSLVKLTLLDVLGRELATLIDGERSAGYHRIRWNGSDANGNKVGSGIYFYRLTAAGESGKQFVKVMKMLMAK